MKKSLDELGIKIIGGQILTRVIADEKGNDEIIETRRTIVAKSIASGYLDDDNIVINNYKTRCDEKRITKVNDIVIKITTPFAAALIDEAHEGLLVSSFCMIINNLPDNLLPEYLVAYLNSEEGIAHVSANMRESTMATISILSLKNLEIVIPSMDKQKKIAKAFNVYLNNLILTQKLISLSKEKLEALIGGVE
jgi:restriction endonuclease S subunit